MLVQFNLIGVIIYIHFFFGRLHKFYELFQFDFTELMGRGRGKGKKLTGATSHDDPGSGNEEPLPPYKRRGRPQKPLKDDIDEEEVAKIEEEDGDLKKIGTPVKEVKGSSAAVENGKRRRRQAVVKENSDLILEENGAGLSSTTEDLSRKNGFRQNGSRRKNKPYRAAEAGVEFK